MDNQWIVLQTEMFPGEPRAAGAYIGATVFDTLEEAKDFLNHVLRDEWKTKVSIPTAEDFFHEELLADHKGMEADDSKWASIYYSPEGDLAWVDRDGVVSLIEVVAMEPKGTRTSTTC